MNLCIDLIERNAYLEGQRQSDKEHKASYAQVLSREIPTETHHEDIHMREVEQNKAALLLNPNQPRRGRELAQAVSVLRAAVTPEDLGLTTPEFRPIRGGAVITSTSTEGIANLEKAINNTEELKRELTTKIPMNRNPQLKLKAILSMPPQELLTKLMSQDQLTGDVEETQVILTFDSGNGLSTVIVEPESPPGVAVPLGRSIPAPGGPPTSELYRIIAPNTRFCKTASHKLVTDIQTKFASNVTGRNKRLVDCSRDDPSIFLIGSGPWADVVRSVMDTAVVVSKRRENSGHCGSGPSCHPGDFSLGHSRAA
ncbi:hypothetical protein HPB47_013634 [Ixodes persulcatus]|uniref:Uncharacterized protein n=1 Tax=Ixodes persulcatus TaxID=34615 RepID=A0AC60R0X1_IXOPE|nr:hypothetical protein HPB47_013634 [Ixodes persulcatus]